MFRTHRATSRAPGRRPGTCREVLAATSIGAAVALVPSVWADRATTSVGAARAVVPSNVNIATVMANEAAMIAPQRAPIEPSAASSQRAANFHAAMSADVLRAASANHLAGAMPAGLRVVESLNSIAGLGTDLRAALHRAMSPDAVILAFADQVMIGEPGGKVFVRVDRMSPDASPGMMGAATVAVAMPIDSVTPARAAGAIGSGIPLAAGDLAGLAIHPRQSGSVTPSTPSGRGLSPGKKDPEPPPFGLDPPDKPALDCDLISAVSCDPPNGGNGDGNGNGNGDGDGDDGGPPAPPPIAPATAGPAGASDGPGRDATDLAEALPDDDGDDAPGTVNDVVDRELVDQVQRAILRQLDIIVRDLRAAELQDRTDGRDLYNDMPAGLQPASQSVEVAINRLRRQSVINVARLYEELFGPVTILENGIAPDPAKLEAIRTALADPTGAQAAGHLADLRALTAELRRMGLTDREWRISTNALLAPITPAGMSVEQLSASVTAS